MKSFVLLLSGFFIVLTSLAQDTTFTLHKSNSDSLVYLYKLKKNKNTIDFSLSLNGLEGSKHKTSVYFNIKSSQFTDSLKNWIKAASTTAMTGLDSLVPDSAFKDALQQDFDDTAEKIYRQIIELSLKKEEVTLAVLDSVIKKAIGADHENVVVGKFRLVAENYFVQVYKEIKKVTPGKIQENMERIKQGTTVNADTNQNTDDYKDTIVGADIFKVDSIEIEIKDGFIKSFEVYGKYKKDNMSSMFRNVIRGKCGGRRYIPVSLSHYLDRLDDLIYDNENEQNFVFLGDVLMYDHALGRNFNPNDTDFVIKDKEKTKILSTDVSLNHQIDFRVYTDALALFNKKPNGLIQFEGNANFIINTSNLRNTNFFLGQKLGAMLNYSQFDSKDIHTISNDTLTNDSLFISKYEVKRQDMLQRTYLTFGASLNLVKKYYRTTLSYTELNFGWQGAFSKNMVLNTTSDTLIKDVFLNTYSLCLVNNIQVLSNFGLMLEANGMFQNIVDRQITNNKYRFVLQAFGTVYFNPFTESSKTSRIFLRGGVFTDFSDRGNVFTRLQIGYSGSISQYIKKGK